jgi:hypothetical protein
MGHLRARLGGSATEAAALAVSQGCRSLALHACRAVISLGLPRFSLRRYTRWVVGEAPVRLGWENDIAPAITHALAFLVRQTGEDEFALLRRALHWGLYLLYCQAAEPASMDGSLT